MAVCFPNSLQAMGKGAKEVLLSFLQSEFTRYTARMKGRLRLAYGAFRVPHSAPLYKRAALPRSAGGAS